MDCFEQLKAQISAIDPAEYHQAFGYANPDKLATAIEKLQQHSDLLSWFQLGFYDLRHTSKSFLLTGAEIFGLPVEQCHKEIEIAEQRLHQLAQAEQPWLTVQLDETGQKQLSKLGFLGRLAISKWLTHSIDKLEVIDLDKAELHAFIAELIKAHQQEPVPKTIGNGKVTGYLYKHTDGTTLHFDQEGNPID